MKALNYLGGRIKQLATGNRLMNVEEKWVNAIFMLRDTSLR
jgi:hypothetical protein